MSKEISSSPSAAHEDDKHIDDSTASCDTIDSKESMGSDNSSNEEWKKDTTTWEKIYEHLVIAVPVFLTFAMRKSVDIVSVIFVGHLGAVYLGSAGLASVTQNVTGNAVIHGLSGALGTISGQANGAKDYKELGLALQRSVLILMVFVCLPVTLLWCYSKPLFILVGLNHEVSHRASLYLIYLIPGAWAMSSSVCIQTWLHAQADTRAIAIITFFLALTHPILCYLFIYKLNFGYLGAAIAVSTTKTLELVGGLIYLGCISSKLVDVDFRWSLECLNSWGHFLSLGLPNVLMMSEWMASEIIIFLSGRLGNPSVDISTMSVYQSVLSICFMLPMGFHVSACTIVGNSLGAGMAEVAKIAAVIAPSLTIIGTVILAGILLISRNQLGYVFTGDEEVVTQLSTLVPLMALYIMMDGVQATLTGAPSQTHILSNFSVSNNFKPPLFCLKQFQTTSFLSQTISNHLFSVFDPFIRPKFHLCLWMYECMSV